MDKVIRELNEVICQEYTITLDCDRELILDRYEEGEMQFVEYIELFTVDKLKDNLFNCDRESARDDLRDNLKEMIEDFLKIHTQYDTLEECMKDNFNYSDHDFIVLQQVNRGYEEPTAGDIELWKSGEKDLFSQYTRIGIKINNKQIDLDLILDLLGVKEER
mgnify:FL=1